MKRIIIAITICLLGISAFAQNKDTTPIVMNGQVIMNADDYDRISLLTRENNLLQRRKTALTISLVGLGTTAIGTAVEAPGLVVLGGAATLVGGVWLIVNEFKLINVQQQINKKLILQINPNGVILRF